MTKLEIAQAVAEKYGLTVEDLRGPRRFRPLVRARQEAFALCRDHAGRRYGRFSFPAIGRFFNRDHTTVHHGVAAHRAREARGVE